MFRAIIPAIFLFFCLFGPGPVSAKWIIAKGGTKVLPESSLAALAVSLAAGANTVLIKAVLSSDSQLVTLSDPRLNERTDVALRFPDRARQDGSYYAFDFTLDELRQLFVSPPAASLPQGEDSSAQPLPGFRIPTLAETLGLIRLYKEHDGHQVGVVIEIEKNWLHRREGRNILPFLVDVLAGFSNTGPDNTLSIASYDPADLKSLKEELLPGSGLNPGLLQLVSDNHSQDAMSLEHGEWVAYNYDWMFTNFGLKAVSSYATGIGLPADLLADPSGNSIKSKYLENAHLLGLSVLAFPFDFPVEHLPDYASDLDSLFEHFLFTIGVDGLCTTAYGPAAMFLQHRQEKTDQNQRGNVPNKIQQLLDNIKNSEESPSALEPFDAPQ